MKTKELKMFFEERVLKGSFFDSLSEVLNDKTGVDVSVLRALIAAELKGVWRGLNLHTEALRFFIEDSRNPWATENGRLTKEINLLKWQLQDCLFLLYKYSDGKVKTIKDVYQEKQKETEVEE